MRTKIRLLWLPIALALTLASGSVLPVQADSGITITKSSVQASFPTSIAFSLSAQSSAPIDDIRLHYTTDRQSFAQVTSEVYISLMPAVQIDTSYTLDLTKVGGLPPGTEITYWWTLVDASGQTLTGPQTQIIFDDNRYTWQTLKQGHVTLYWYDGGDSFAQALMAAAQASLARMATDTGSSLDQDVKIYIYASAADLQSAMVYPQEWTGGVAYTNYGIIAIGIAPSNLDWGKLAITHELTHLLTYQETANPYNDIPTWLNEGLSMYAEGPLDSLYLNYLNVAIAQHTLIGVRSLASPFSSNTDLAYLSYAESFSLVQYLITQYGAAKMSDLLATFKAGATYDGALEKVYGFDMDGLNAQWQASLPVLGQMVWRPWLIALVALVASGGVASLVWIWTRRRPTLAPAITGQFDNVDVIVIGLVAFTAYWLLIIPVLR